ncbi:NAD(P)/FAD-dependent oxidoreductase [Allobranchiibius sp. CTAmp26]|uniref:NAD(P)/FAD-dependent oxidoreductase n=1 Tax=Allobranchiibius sp. CTAmp26 TaxID=2815214 RepID=UPI001AA15994|nr:NAD(P)/FAD-dependent oxidoreductase [Allobranchiibius sp. CTAmp26]MBO1753573.1 NAD(P)/FAD-dependent oxidoreductase [Allobranchiibius sp. CTAmp26]
MRARRRRGEREATSGDRPTVVVVGAGFAGFHTLRRLERTLSPEQANLVLVAPSDYLLYSPLLPEVATGVLDPRDIAVSLRQTLRRTTPVFGHVTDVDFDSRTLTVLGRDGTSGEQRWDRLVLTPGSVTREFDIPGVAEHARGLKTLEEATFLRNHVLGQLDLADALPDTPMGRQQRQELLTVVAVGAGYTGTEFVAQMQNWMYRIADRWSSFGPDDVRWLLIDLAPHVLPELGPRLGAEAMKVLHRRGVEVRLTVSVASATATSVTLTDGDVISTRTLVWSAGVAPSPLIATLGLPTTKGRLVVNDDLSVPGLTHVWALGDSAAVPDLAMSLGADGTRPVTAPTAQHAQRQGHTAARNVAASLGVGQARRYRHRDLGLVADLGGTQGVAKALGVPLTGPIAKVTARGYHLFALPSTAAKVRVGTDWLYASILPTRVVQLSNVQAEDVSIAAAQHTGIYPPPPDRDGPVSQ